MIRGELMKNPDDISDRIVDFYQTNEKQNNPENNFPMYSTITMKQIDDNIAIAEKAAEDIENTPDAAQEIIDFKWKQYDEWVNKKEALKLYGKNELREIHFQAHIRVEVQKETAYELFAKIQSEIEEALFDLRDGAAKKVFNESYAAITKRYESNEGDKAKAAQAQEDKAKIDLLKILYPDRIIEVTPKR